MVDLQEKVLLAKSGELDASVSSARILTDSKGRAMAFAYWSIISSTSKVVDEAFPGRQIDWGEIMEDTLWVRKREKESSHSIR